MAYMGFMLITFIMIVLTVVYLGAGLIIITFIKRYVDGKYPSLNLDTTSLLRILLLPPKCHKANSEDIHLNEDRILKTLRTVCWIILLPYALVLLLGTIYYLNILIILLSYAIQSVHVNPQYIEGTYTARYGNYSEKLILRPNRSYYQVITSSRSAKVYRNSGKWFYDTKYGQYGSEVRFRKMYDPRKQIRVDRAFSVCSYLGVFRIHLGLNPPIMYYKDTFYH